MPLSDKTERLRRLAHDGDRDAGRELMRLLRRRNGLDGQCGTTYRTTVYEAEENWHVDLTTVDAIFVTVHDLRFAASVNRRTRDSLDIVVVPLWGDPPMDPPVMDIALVTACRGTIMLRIGGPSCTAF